MRKKQKKLTQSEIQEWFKARLIELLKLKPDEIDVTLTFDYYDLDSTMAVGLTYDLEEWLGYELDPTVLYEYPTIEQASQYLAENSP